MESTNWRGHTNNMTIAERAEALLCTDYRDDIDMASPLTTFGHVCANAELGRRAAAEKEAHKLREEVEYFTEAYMSMTGQAFELVAQRDEARAEVERLNTELAQAERRGAMKALRRAEERKLNHEHLGNMIARIERGEEVL